ncbi:MAG TPA: RNA polymerase sigma factor [Pirellulales bacterium]
MAPVEEKLDPALVAALFVRHGQELRAFLTGVLRNVDLADEALQTAFGKTIEHGHAVQDESLKSWLFRVAFHEALALKRKRQTADRANEQLARRAEQNADDAWGRPEKQLMRLETVAQVRSVLERLPAEQREVVHKRIYEDKTFATIAAEQGCPLGTVLSRMQAALKRLREALPPSVE